MSQRESRFDVAKGICIVAVVMIHASGSALGRTLKFTDYWWTTAFLNRALQFAVPAFLMISAILLARSLSRSTPDWKRYAGRRVQMVVWPYLVWTAIYIVYRYKVGTITSVQLDSVKSWLGYLLLGKANFHLYFMSVLIQLMIVLPFVVALLKRLRIGFGAVFGASLLLFVVVYLVNLWRPFPYPASLITWYLPELFVGAWVGVHWDQASGAIRRRRRLIVAGMLLGAALNLSQSIPTLADHKGSSFLLLLGMRLYAPFVTLLILDLAGSWHGVFGRIAEWLGNQSLAIYLVHPIALVWLTMRAKEHGFEYMAIYLAYATLGTLAISALIAQVINWSRLSLVLLGRPSR